MAEFGEALGFPPIVTRVPTTAAHISGPADALTVAFFAAFGLTRGALIGTEALTSLISDWPNESKEIRD